MNFGRALAASSDVLAVGACESSQDEEASSTASEYGECKSGYTGTAFFRVSQDGQNVTSLDEVLGYASGFSSIALSSSSVARSENGVVTVTSKVSSSGSNFLQKGTPTLRKQNKKGREG